MARAFGQHVERSLCFESFQFLQETLAYTTLATAASSSAAASIPEQAQVRITSSPLYYPNKIVLS